MISLSGLLQYSTSIATAPSLAIRIRLNAAVTDIYGTVQITEIVEINMLPIIYLPAAAIFANANPAKRCASVSIDRVNMMSNDFVAPFWTILSSKSSGI
jgi:hypothetical protein